MVKRPTKISALVYRNYAGSIGVCFAIFVVLTVLFAFNLEDKIFENQVSVKADEIAISQSYQVGTAGAVSGLEMQYYHGTDAMPDWLAGQIKPDWTNGEYEVFGGEKGHYHLAVRGKSSAGKIYLIFNARPFVRSTDQIQEFVIFLVILGGLMMVIVWFFLLRMTRKVTAPVEKIASAAVSGTPLKQVDFDQDNIPAEIATLAKAITEKDNRIQSLLDREREFNRDVSHELRTPLSIAIGAAEIVEKEQVKTGALGRLITSLGDMQLLTEGILWLGRTPDQGESCNAKAACEYAIRTNKHLLADRKVNAEIVGEATVNMPVPETVAQVIIGNLVRNAFRYTENGSVTLSFSEGQLCVEDTGVGYGNVTKDNSGFGVGLSLVKRLCAHFGLQIVIANRDNQGTKATIRW